MPCQQSPCGPTDSRKLSCFKGHTRRTDCSTTGLPVTRASAAILMLSKRETMDAGKHAAISEEHAAPLIQILTCLFLAVSTLSIATQFATRRAMRKPFNSADGILLIALVFHTSEFDLVRYLTPLQILAVGQAVCFLHPAGQSIGNSRTSMSEDTAIKALKVGRSLTLQR